MGVAVAMVEVVHQIHQRHGTSHHNITPSSSFPGPPSTRGLLRSPTGKELGQMICMFVFYDFQTIQGFQIRSLGVSYFVRLHDCDDFTFVV